MHSCSSMAREEETGGGRRRPGRTANQHLHYNTIPMEHTGPQSTQQPAETSQQLPRADAELTIAEKQYLLACERGDLAKVRHLLTQHSDSPQFNPNCTDPLGRTALRIAIENENSEMMQTLLEHSVETGDALLHAISEENVEAVELLLDYLDKEDKFSAERQGVEITDRSTFTPDLTPIILAAHRDNYEIIKLLLDRGATIPHPHDVRCICRDCLLATMEDSLRLSRSRINAYRALSSPSLICLSARDPILYAFEMSWELRRLSNIENEFKAEYEELSQKCQQFAVDLLDQTRGSKELEIILNYDNSDRYPVRERAPGERMQLTRLKLAIQYRQKKFVAHPNCQQLLASIWYEGLPGFRRRHVVFKMLLILAIAFGFPLLSLVYLVAPKTALGKFVRQPFIKFLCHSSSYCFFLMLLILASQRINYDSLFGAGSSSVTGATTNESEIGTDLEATYANDNIDRKERRGPPPTPVEWAIIVWVVGLIWVEVKQLWSMGLYEYTHNMWNILDFITNCLYMATIALRIIAYVGVKLEIASLPAHLKPTAMHWPRRNWDAWDPTLISECVFATANIFSSLKLVHIFTVNPHLGPLQISLGRMVIDIVKFFIVYCLVLFAFACGLNQLFWYYATMRSNECQRLKGDDDADNDEVEKSCDPRFSSFGNLYNTVETLFWSIFGLIGLDHFELSDEHHITVWVGKTMFGTYGYISVVVLLNMLIAMMSNSYQYISNQADAEWKFARSKLWIEYFEESGTCPVPFNIIPSPKTLYYGLRWALDRFCRCARRNHRVHQRSLRLQKILKAVSQREANYQFVMGNLVKRYVAFVQRSRQQAEGVSEDDVNEIKQDVNAFRYELLDILRKNGFQFDTGPANAGGGRSKRRNAEAERRLMKGSQFYSGHNRPEAAPADTSEYPSNHPLYWTRQGQKLSFRHHRMQVKAAQLASSSVPFTGSYSSPATGSPTTVSTLALSQQGLAKFKMGLSKRLPIARRLMELAAIATSQSAVKSASESAALNEDETVKGNPGALSNPEEEEALAQMKGIVRVDRSTARKRSILPYSRSLTLCDETDPSDSFGVAVQPTVLPGARTSFLWARSASADDDGTDSLLDIEAQADDTLL